MTSNSSLPGRDFIRRSRRWLSLAGLALAVGILAAQPLLRADDADDKNLSDDVSAGLDKIHPLLDAKDYDGAFQLIDGFLAKAKPDSFDLAVLLDTKAKVYCQKEDYGPALPLWQQCMTIAEPRKFFERHTIADTYNAMAQIAYGQAMAANQSKPEQLRNLDLAKGFLDHYFLLAEKVSPETYMFYAGLLYAEAITRNGDKPDPTYLKLCDQQIHRILLMSPHPKDDVYLLLIPTLQQENDYADAADYLELYLAKHPENKGLWPTLTNLYISLADSASSAKPANERLSRRYYLRAINTIERAQSHGSMTSTKENFSLVSLYYSMENFEKASQLLADGLRSGAIDSEMSNYDLLSYCYQRQDRMNDAIEALKTASTLWPDDFKPVFQIAQLYSSVDDNKQALEYYRQAVSRTRNVSARSLFLAYSYMAYCAYQLDRLPEALESIHHAEALPPARTDTNLPRLKTAIEEAIKEHPAAPATT